MLSTLTTSFALAILGPLCLINNLGKFTAAERNHLRHSLRTTYSKRILPPCYPTEQHCRSDAHCNITSILKHKDHPFMIKCIRGICQNCVRPGCRARDYQPSSGSCNLHNDRSCWGPDIDDRTEKAVCSVTGACYICSKVPPTPPTNQPRVRDDIFILNLECRPAYQLVRAACINNEWCETYGAKLEADERATCINVYCHACSTVTTSNKYDTSIMGNRECRSAYQPVNSRCRNDQWCQYFGGGFDWITEDVQCIHGNCYACSKQSWSGIAKLHQFFSIGCRRGRLLGDAMCTHDYTCEDSRIDSKTQEAKCHEGQCFVCWKSTRTKIDFTQMILPAFMKAPHSALLAEEGKNYRQEENVAPKLRQTDSTQQASKTSWGYEMKQPIQVGQTKVGSNESSYDEMMKIWPQNFPPKQKAKVLRDFSFGQQGSLLPFNQFRKWKVRKMLKQPILPNDFHDLQRERETPPMPKGFEIIWSGRN